MKLSNRGPGRPPLRGEPKVRLTLSVTPTTRRYLSQLQVQQAQRSIAEVIEDWTAGMATLDRPLKPLGKGSPRPGKVAARGQALNASGECKVQLNLRVTAITKARLQQLAEEGCDEDVNPSMSDILERWMISMAELIDLMELIKAKEEQELAKNKTPSS